MTSRVAAVRERYRRPSTVATGATREETERHMYEAIQLHVEGLLADKQPIPTSTSFAEYVVVPA